MLYGSSAALPVKRSEPSGFFRGNNQKRVQKNHNNRSIERRELR